MDYTAPVKSVSFAVEHALNESLNFSDIGHSRTVRDIDVYLFPQKWSSTALGFGGVGCSAMATADTVVIFGPNFDASVYFGPKFAYHVSHPNEKFYEDLSLQRMEAVKNKDKYEHFDRRDSDE